MGWAWEPVFGSISSEHLQVRAPEPFGTSGQPGTRLVGKTSPLLMKQLYFYFLFRMMPIRHCLGPALLIYCMDSTSEEGLLVKDYLKILRWLTGKDK